jgi:hypothetical protein
VGHDEQLTLEDDPEDPSAYLIPELESPEEEREILKECYERHIRSAIIFMVHDPGDWPKKRDLKIFLEWFDIQFHSLVFDLLNEPREILDYGRDNDVGPGFNGN